MPTRAHAAAWVGLAMGLVLLPLLLLASTGRAAAGGFWWDFSLALGYAGLSAMALQSWLTARFRRASAPFGIDVLYLFHRYLALAGFAILVAHAAILLLRHPAAAGGLDPRSVPAHVGLGWFALVTFAVLLVSSLWRKRLRLEYDRWRRLHVVLALLGMGSALWHVVRSGDPQDAPLVRAYCGGLVLAWLGLVLHVRVLRPWRLSRRPWRVISVEPERGRSWTLGLEPPAGKGFAYRPGQFAWVTLRASPWALREHPFSFSSSPTREGHVTFTVKELGDFTSRIGEIRPGEPAHVDGPYGSFGIDHEPAARAAVFVAGGVGIAPVISQLRALADRGDRRKLWLFYGNRDWERVVFREELDALSGRLDLTVVHVLGEPPPDWRGEQGLISPEVLARHLPAVTDGLHAFVCGPTPMIRLVERGLRALGVPMSRIHSEIFDLA